MLDKLNQQQRKAVTTTSKKVLVMAGAGSGKTLVLTNRIAYLLKSGVSEANILAFTFTNKAALEMKQRVERMLGRETNIVISTFHSFCYSFVRDFSYNLGFKDKPFIIFDSDKSQIIRNILDEINPNYANTEFIANISKLKNNAPIPDLREDEALILNQVYEKYQKYLLDNNALDFDDMVPLFIKLMKVYPFVGDYIKDRAEYVLVDEFQDTNQIQYDFITELTEYHKNIFCCGDEDQLVYSFRSSDISIINNFKLYADEIIVLNQNYRCSKNILKPANVLIDHNTGRMKKDLTSDINIDKLVSYNEYDSTYQEAEEVVEKILNLLENGYKLDDIAVLYRNNNQSFLIEKELLKNKIDYILYGGHPFYQYKDIRWVISVHRFINNPNNFIAFSNIYNFPNTIFEITELTKFETFNSSNKQNNIIENLLCYNNPNVQALGEKLALLHSKYETSTPEEFYKHILEILEFNKYLKKSKNQKKIYNRIDTLKESLVEYNNHYQVLEYFDTMLLENEKKEKPRNGVSLLTIHRSKGLEFKVVFIIGCNEGIIPGVNLKEW